MPEKLSLLLSRQILVVVTIAILVPLALATGFGLWAARQIDADGLAQEQRLATGGLKEAIDSIAVEQDTSSVWDEAVLQVAAGDQEWIAENLADWISDYFGHERVFILDRNDVVVRAVEQGQEADAALFDQDGAIYAALVAELRAEMAEASEGSLDSTESVTGLGVLDIARLSDGQVAAVSVRPIVPSTDRVQQAPGTEALHVSVRLLSPSLMHRIGEKFTLSDLSFVESVPGPASIAVRDRAGNALGYLTWTPDRAAMRLLQTTAPALLGVLLIGCAIVVLLILILRKTAARLLASQAHARHLAYHDPLTGLPNRALFEDRLARALLSLRETRKAFALHYVDLDHFKHINDTMGHPVGDELIRNVARRLSGVVQPMDTVARIGGDEFAVIQHQARDDAEVETFARSILDAFEEPADIGGEPIKVAMSIGSALAASPTSADDLMRNADIALYEAKADGRGRMKLFQGNMDELVRQRRAMERDLRATLASRDGLYMMFQPIFDREGLAIGAEALARWKHPHLGLVSPQLFIRLAEERGLIEPLGMWVLEEACRVLKSTSLPWLAINISPLQCNDPNLALRITAALTSAGINPSRLQIEITEGVLLANSIVVRNNLAQLRQVGVRVALDDFGTGYASISYLRNHGIDKLKIDKSFVHTMATDHATRSIVKAIIALARAMGMSVTMEGVETLEQRDHALLLGADELQGFLLSQPVAEAEIAGFYQEPEGIRAVLRG